MTFSWFSSIAQLHLSGFRPLHLFKIFHTVKDYALIHEGPTYYHSWVCRAILQNTRPFFHLKATTKFHLSCTHELWPLVNLQEIAGPRPILWILGWLGSWFVQSYGDICLMMVARSVDSPPHSPQQNAGLYCLLLMGGSCWLHCPLCMPLHICDTTWFPSGLIPSFM